MDTETPTESTPTVEHLFVTVNGIKLHVAEAKPDNATSKTPLVLCLHGFPEFWGAWHRQLPALVDAGYRVWMPDLRGYNLSESPRKTADYRMDVLKADVGALIQASGAKRCMLVAHDWGAAIAWCAAAAYPELIEKMVIANVPHPRVFRRTLFTSARQMMASWYIFFFQRPWIPEWLLSRNNFAGLTKAMVDTANSGSFSPADMEGYQAAWRHSGLTSMIRYYRAAMRYQDIEGTDTITVPTLILWGKKDHALTHPMATKSLEYCTDGQLFFFEDGTHWVQHDCHEEFNTKMIDFLGSP